MNSLLNITLRLADMLLRVNFIGVYNYYRSIDRFDGNKLEEIQDRNLKELLIYASDKTKFYSGLSSDKFTHWPVISKDQLRDFPKYLLSDEFKRDTLILEKSSGSTGKRTAVYLTKREAFASIAIQTYLWSWSGYEPGKKIVQLGMTTERKGLKRYKDILFRTKYFSAFEIDDNIIDKNIESIISYQPEFFAGYASGLYAYAKRLNERGIKQIKLKAVISYGDKMFDHYRKEISEAFGCKVYDTYGSTEGFVIAGQCEFGAYHVLTPHVKLEILGDNNKEVSAGDFGRVVVTRLDSRAFPLIRYDLGDLAIRSLHEDSKCGCGRSYPRIEKIIGRNTDIIETPGGKKLIVHFFTGIFEHLSEVIQFKVVIKEGEDMEIQLVVDVEDDRVEELFNDILEKIYNRANEVFKIKLVKVEKIENSTSGKPQIIEYIK